MHMRARRAPGELTRVELPDGRHVTLDRPFSAYSAPELAELGILPSLGDGATVQIIPTGGRPLWRRLRPRRLS